MFEVAASAVRNIKKWLRFCCNIKKIKIWGHHGSVGWVGIIRRVWVWPKVTSRSLPISLTHSCPVTLYCPVITKAKKPPKYLGEKNETIMDWCWYTNDSGDVCDFLAWLGCRLWKTGRRTWGCLKLPLLLALPNQLRTLFLIWMSWGGLFYS